ncbi:protein SMG5 [Galendromus occidentalis]|uniref:Protein SMG5 n=1 Tax=Galendromus occidentalis TaxID=34638 RepID=A0AAJ7WH89_9ACAR|nr:protein SMG5 [Galendromus occidentalis]
MEITESTKKHYRALGEVVRRCDASKQDLLLRQQLRDYAEKALFGAPLEFGRKAEDALWRKAYYEPLTYFKTRKEKSSWSLAAIQQLLSSGLGAYHRILIRLEDEFGVPLSGIMDVSLSESMGRRLDEFPSDKVHEMNEWALQCAHRCLIAQGDLERYLHELGGQQDSCSHRLSSLRFYQQAILLQPRVGQPYNQLGTLEGTTLYSLRSLYYFLRCLLSPEPFIGGASNLKATFDKNRVALQKARSTAQSTGKDHEELHVRSFIVIVESLWNEEVPDRSTVSTVIDVLKVESFQSGVLFYCVLVLLAVDERMRNLHRDETHTNTKTVRELMTVISTRMILEVYHNLCMKTCLEHPFSNDAPAVKPVETIPAPGEGIIPKRPRAKYRRRRKAFGDSSDEENDDHEIISFVESATKMTAKQADSRRRTRPGSNGSDGQGDEQTPSETSEESSVDSEDDFSSDDEVASEAEGKRSVHSSSPVNQLSREFTVNSSLSCRQLVKQVISERMMGAIKLSLDWMLLDAATKNIDMCFIKRACDFSNLVSVLLHRVMGSSDGTIEHVRKQLTRLTSKGLALNSVPLPEDIQYSLLMDRLQNKPPLSNAVLLQSWEKRSQVSTDGQRSVFRLHYINDVIGKLCELLPKTDVSIIPGQRIILQDHVLESLKAQLEKSPLPASCQKTTRQQGLMKSMAHAWLQHEVRGLEEKLDGRSLRNSLPISSNGLISFSSDSRNHGSKKSIKYTNSLYTVVDASVLAHHLPLIRNMVASRSSIVVIPKCVVSELDEMKKDVATARDANRWLSSELPKGLRYLRVQRAEEATPIAVLKYPKKKDRDAWKLFQILECCQYFNGKGNFGPLEVNNNSNGNKDGSSSTALVSFLYSKPESQLPANVTSLTETLGIKLLDVNALAVVNDSKHLPPKYRESKANKQTG